MQKYVTIHKKIFNQNLIENIIFTYTDYVDAEKCYNRIIREIRNEKNRNYNSEIILSDSFDKIRLYKSISNATIN